MTPGKLNLPIIEPGATYREIIEWVSTVPLYSLKYDTATSKVIAVCQRVHNLSTGNLINIREVLPFSYNITSVSITVIDVYTFSYTPLVVPTTSARLINLYSLQVPINLTGCTASLKIFSQVTGLQILELSTSNGRIALDVLEGVFNLFIDDTDTLTVPVTTKNLPHKYTLEVFHPNNDTTFLIKGFLSSPCRISGLNSSLFTSGNDDMIVITAPQGAPGVSGIGGDNNIEDFSFSWGDATPALLLTASAGESIIRVEIAILTPFDTPSTLSVGDSTDNQRLFPSTSIDLSSVGTYTSNITFKYIGSTPVNLYLNSGIGNTQGNGLIFIYST